MKIQRIQNCNFGAQTPKKTPQTKVLSPVRDGLNTAGLWFGFGVALDLLSRKVRFAKSPFKNSLALNGIIGGAAGLVVWLQDLNKKSDE